MKPNMKLGAAVRRSVPISGVLAGVLAASLCPTAAAAAPAPPCFTIGSITAAKGDTFSGADVVSWNASSTCPEVKYFLNGAPIAKQGTKSVNPTLGTAYKFTAKNSASSGISTLSEVVVVGGDVISYQQFGSSLIPVSRFNSPQSSAVMSMANKITKKVDNPYRSNLIGKKVEVHIIPSNVPLTRLPDFTHLGNTGGVVDRDWSVVRGIGGTPVANDTQRIAMAVGEEEMAPTPQRDNAYPFGYVMSHEYGHTILDNAAPNLKGIVDNIRKDRIEAGGDFLGLDSYSSSNLDEYWADGTAAFFKYPYSGSPKNVAEFTPSWVSSNDTPLFNQLWKVFSK
ncbi:hypothetical protein [Streptomyces sp. NPDC088748]|uniref:hypothetical protein n=1 Tax=Streptomyces sp. NPDC088748 TaxID=3365887 RepID=UPI00380E8A9D